MPRKTIPFSFLLIGLIVFSLFCLIPFVSAATVFTDGFEDGTFTKWTDGGATTWSMGTSSTPGSPWAPHAGTYMAYANSGDDGSLTTDNIDCSTGGVTGIRVQFYYMEDDVDAADNFYLYYFDGTNYDFILDLQTATEDTWLLYDQTTTDAQYRVSNFRVRITATSPDSGEATFIDDVTVDTVSSSSYSKTGSITMDWSSTNSRIYKASRSASQAFDWASTVSGLLSYGRAAQWQLQFNDPQTSRIPNYARAATQTFSWSSTVDSFSNFMRAAAQALSFSSSVSRSVIFPRASSLTVNWDGSVSRTQQLFRSAAQSISWASSVVAGLAYDVAASISVAFSSSTARIWDALGAASLQINLAFSNTVGFSVSYVVTLILDWTSHLTSPVPAFEDVTDSGDVAEVVLAILICGVIALIVILMIWRRKR